MSPEEVNLLSELYAAETILGNAYEYLREQWCSGKIQSYDALWALLGAKQAVIEDRLDQQEPGRML